MPEAHAGIFMDSWIPNSKQDTTHHDRSLHAIRHCSRLARCAPRLHVRVHGHLPRALPKTGALVSWDEGQDGLLHEVTSNHGGRVFEWKGKSAWNGTEGDKSVPTAEKSDGEAGKNVVKLAEG